MQTREGGAGCVGEKSDSIWCCCGEDIDHLLIVAFDWAVVDQARDSPFPLS